MTSLGSAVAMSRAGEGNLRRRSFSKRPRGGKRET
jgi:hypothetical protein